MSVETQEKLFCIFIKECFKITGRGIIAEIQHTQNGLPSGTLLYSKLSNKTWEVKNRLTFSHIENLQKLFDNESISPVFMNFSNIEQFEKSKSDILQREKDNIFQYLLKNDENALPSEGEELICTTIKLKD